jgi:glutathione S-transferase
MKLYFFPVAPNPTKVRLYLAEKAAGGAEIDLTEIQVSLLESEQRNPEHLARNPFGKLPVLELDDGTHLIESLAIIEYLEELHPDPPLIGSTPRERALVRETERVADLGVLIPVGMIVHATNSPLGLPPKPEVAGLFRERLPEALQFLDRRLADGRPFLAGERPSVADCTLAAAFQFGRFRDVEFDASFENIARWDEAFRSRPSAKSVLVL